MVEFAAIDLVEQGHYNEHIEDLCVMDGRGGTWFSFHKMVLNLFLF